MLVNASFSLCGMSLGGWYMKIGFVSSRKYAQMVRDLVESEFSYIDVITITYIDHTRLPEMLKVHQRECDALLFSGDLGYRYCRAYCPQEVPWVVVKPQSSTLANALRTALQRNYDISRISIDYSANSGIKSACRELGIEYKSMSPIVFDYTVTDYLSNTHNDQMYRFHRKNLNNHQATCCITSNLVSYNRLVSEGVPTVFMEISFDTFRQAFYNLYRQLTDKFNHQAQMVAIVIENDLPGEYSVINRDEYQYMSRRLAISKKVYLFASKLQGIVSEIGFNQYLIISTRNDFDHETQEFKEFDLFEEINNDVLNNYAFGIGYGLTAIASKKNAYTALERAKSYGRNSACLVASGGETLSIVSYIKQKNKVNHSGSNEKISDLSQESGISVARLIQIFELVEMRKSNCFTSTQLAELLGISKRSMDRIIVKLESASLAKIIGQRSEASCGRPSRIIELQLSK